MLFSQSKNLLFIFEHSFFILQQVSLVSREAEEEEKLSRRQRDEDERREREVNRRYRQTKHFFIELHEEAISVYRWREAVREKSCQTSSLFDIAFFKSEKWDEERVRDQQLYIFQISSRVNLTIYFFSLDLLQRRYKWRWYNKVYRQTIEQMSDLSNDCHLWTAKLKRRDYWWERCETSSWQISQAISCSMSRVLSKRKSSHYARVDTKLKSQDRKIKKTSNRRRRTQEFCKVFIVNVMSHSKYHLDASAFEKMSVNFIVNRSTENSNCYLRCWR